MFVSKVKIFVKAGNGGRGVVSFRREKYVPYGGPDGGDGGKGGNIVIESDRNLNTLAFFKYHRHFMAENGSSGMRSNMTGKSGADCIIKVPIGTAIYDEDNNLIWETTTNLERYIVYEGGRGGIGNSKMATSVDRAPRTTIAAETREMRELTLLLTLQTDIGILGAPNSGKSSLINILSRANSVVGDYPFTTLNPVLGQMYETNISLMDLPGIIEGACHGKGRGLEFLRHSQQCKIFIHLVDASKTPEKDYNMILNEIRQYGNELIHKPAILVFNKIDLISEEELNIMRNIFPEAIFISVNKNINIDILREKIISYYNLLNPPIEPVEDEDTLKDEDVYVNNENLLYE